MADQRLSRTNRILIERLESRRLLSAGFPGQQQIAFHGYERASGFFTPPAPFHRDFGFGRDAVAPNEIADRAAAPAVIILAAPNGQVVGFVPLFVGWRPTEGSAGALHWAGHDSAPDVTGDPALSQPSSQLHAPHYRIPDGPDDGHDPNASQASPTPTPGQGLGQVTGAEGPIATPSPSGQVYVIILPVNIKIEPKFVSPENRAAATGPQVSQQQGPVENPAPSTPALERSPAAIPATASVSAAPAAVMATLQSRPFSAVSRVAIETAAVVRTAAMPETPAGMNEAPPVKTGELLTTIGSAGNAAQIAVSASGPAAAVGAIRIAGGWVRSAAAVIGRAFDAPASVSDLKAEYATPVAYNFLRIHPAMLFNDAVGRMIRESASLAPGAASPNHRRAWAITGAVVAADAILVGYWHVDRRRKLRQSRRQSGRAAARRLPRGNVTPA